MVILGFISTAGIIWRNYLPQSAELLSIIAGDTSIPAYQIQVLPGGTEIELRGGLRAGSARELERILAAVPRAKVLHIESPGGRIAEANRMMDLVHRHNLTTYTSEYCLSAATMVLMSGKERVIAANAKVGFHAGSFPGLTPEQQKQTDDLLRATMHSAGVSQTFIDRVLATPPDQMWYPSFDEMRANGVITSESFGDRFAVAWAQSDEELDNVVAKLGEQPQLRKIRQVDPNAYARMMDEFKVAIRSGKSEREALAIAASRVSKLFNQSAELADLNRSIEQSDNSKEIDVRVGQSSTQANLLKETVARQQHGNKFDQFDQPTESQQRPGPATVIVRLSGNETLNVRAEATAESAIVAVLRSGDRVFIGPDRSINDTKGIHVTWQRITTSAGSTGWVNADYISPAIGDSVKPNSLGASTSAITADTPQPNKFQLAQVTVPAQLELHMRSEHNSKSTLVGSLHRGDRVWLEDEQYQNNEPPFPITWRKVTTMTGESGWVNAEYLSKLP